MFVEHAKERSTERKISQDEAHECICCGTTSNWEKGTNPESMRLKFSKTSRTEIIEVVVSLLDEDPSIYVVTMWARKPRGGR